MQKISDERIAEITKEFKEGFKFLEGYTKSVTFFGANQFKTDNKHYQDAHKLSKRIAEELGYSIVSGGGPGIMEAANRGALEAGKDSLGLLIELPEGQLVNKYITNSILFYYFFVRKVCLAFSAEAFIFYPGGFGTLDEFFEILTLIQTKKIEGVPLICVGSEYWDKLKEFMKNEIYSRGAINESDLELFHITDSHEEIIKIIKETPVTGLKPFNGHNNNHS
jgi:uncharacterized protein (TIGR00730 family)